MDDLKTKVYKDLIHRIVVQDLKPGERINSKNIMEQYNIGQTPLRETLLLLEQDGLIKRFPRSGTIVAPVDFMDLRDAAEIRLALESLVVELAIKNITDDQIVEIEELTNALANAAKKGVNANFISTETKLHKCLYLATNNSSLIKILNKQQLLFARMWYSYERSTGDLQTQIDDWELACKYLRNKDVEGLRGVIVEHFKTFYNNLRSMFTV